MKPSHLLLLAAAAMPMASCYQRPTSPVMANDEGFAATNDADGMTDQGNGVGDNPGATPPSAPTDQVVSVMGSMPSAPIVTSAIPTTALAPVPSPAVQTAEQAPPEAAAASRPKPPEIDQGQICAAAIGIIMNRNPSSMRLFGQTTANPRVQYMREDGTRWTYGCSVGEDSVTWRVDDGTGPGNGPGRWRTEDIISYSAGDYGLVISVNGATRRFLPATAP